MNLEKTINKNMFDMTAAVREQNPLATTTEQMRTDAIDASLTSILTHPKQKLTAQFKRAITMMKQRSESGTEESPTLRTSISLIEKPLQSFDSTMLTSLIEEPTVMPNVSSTSVSIKPIIEPTAAVQDTDTSITATIINFDPLTRTHPSPVLPANLVKKSLQQIHSSILQTMNQPAITPTNPIGSTPSPASTTGTGEIDILETLL
jgi:hypothetical protein